MVPRNQTEERVEWLDAAGRLTLSPGRTSVLYYYAGFHAGILSGGILWGLVDGNKIQKEKGKKKLFVSDPSNSFYTRLFLFYTSQHTKHRLKPVPSIILRMKPFKAGQTFSLLDPVFFIRLSILLRVVVTFLNDLLY